MEQDGYSVGGGGSSLLVVVDDFGGVPYDYILLNILLLLPEPLKVIQTHIMES